MDSLSFRPRRLRRSAAIRDLVQETSITAKDFIYPVFVLEDGLAKKEIQSMPGMYQMNGDDLCKEASYLASIGIRGLAIFPCVSPDKKNDQATEATHENALVYRTITRLKQAVPEMLIFSDVALDPYTSHGHDGLLNKEQTDVMNDETIEVLVKMSQMMAASGADFVAPSDMMDGRIGAIRDGLDQMGYTDTSILAYSAKFASAYYGPFRDAVGSKLKGDSISKSTYQLNPANRRESFIEIALDESEGADMLMVKPAGAYLDIIRDVRERTNLPLAAYQVSGEYAQIVAASQNGWLDYKRARDESLIAIKRAGADIILSYFAKEVAEGK